MVFSIIFVAESNLLHHFNHFYIRPRVGTSSSSLPTPGVIIVLPACAAMVWCSSFHSLENGETHLRSSPAPASHIPHPFGNFRNPSYPSISFRNLRNPSSSCCLFLFISVYFCFDPLVGLYLEVPGAISGNRQTNERRS